VRLTRIENLNLNLFEFDYDLTMMIFFMDADGRVYGRYGGRDARNADNRQSLAGLHYTMESVLAMHNRQDKVFAPRSQPGARYIRNEMSSGFRRGCLHCHQVKEIQNANLQRQGQWDRDLAWRYPLPDNLGLVLDVNRGNVIKKVKDKSPAASAGLQPGDVVQRLDGVPIHSFGDAQFALDHAPKTGAITIAWQRGEKVLEEKLSLPEGWRKTDLTWRPSMHRLLPSLRLSGTDLTAEERKTLALSGKQLAFRQKATLSASAKAAGVLPGDIILGLNGQQLDMDYIDFTEHVRSHYLVGDRVTLNLLRDGKRLELPLTLQR
jgi:predicted metalloprotease with PDZ domain